MSAKVKVLIEGYVEEDVHVVPTTTLIQDEDINIIVDPGMGKNKIKEFEHLLKKENLDFSDIDIVFTTHYHLDHTQYVGLFPNAKLIDYLFSYENDTWLEHGGDGHNISPQVKIIHTPGHSYEHASLVVDSKKGVIVVAGDVWWFSDMTPKKDEMALDQNKLEKSRKKVLDIADYVIPGHGAMFKVEK